MVLCKDAILTASSQSTIKLCTQLHTAMLCICPGSFELKWVIDAN